MYKEKKIFALIPARSGSRRLPRKNILPFKGKPLIAWTIEQAFSSGIIDRVIVSTDDDEIAQIAKQWKAEVLRRPAELANDTATTFDVAIHVLDALRAANYEPSLVVLLQVTSPLREKSDIIGAVECWQQHQDSTVISVCELNNPAAAWSFVVDNHSYLNPILGWDILTKRSQEVPNLYIPNGAVYVFTPLVIRTRGRLLGPPLIPYVMPIERSIDIDTQEEFQKAEARMHEI